MKALSRSAFLALITTATAFQCKDKQVVDTMSIGEAGEVLAEPVACNTVETHDLASKRDPVACGLSCTTYCFSPAGGGPNPYDCLAVANNLPGTYPSGNIEIMPGANSWSRQDSCISVIVNQADYKQTICISDWGGITTQVAFDCQSEEDAHGGICVGDGWYIQVQPHNNLCWPT